LEAEQNLHSGFHLIAISNGPLKYEILYGDHKSMNSAWN